MGLNPNLRLYPVHVSVLACGATLGFSVHVRSSDAAQPFVAVRSSSAPPRRRRSTLTQIDEPVTCCTVYISKVDEFTRGSNRAIKGS